MNDKSLTFSLVRYPFFRYWGFQKKLSAIQHSQFHYVIIRERPPRWHFPPKCGGLYRFSIQVLSLSQSRFWRHSVV